MSNKDFIRESNFTFTFGKIKDAAYNCQAIELPAISMGVMDVPSPKLDYPQPGSKLQYDPLSFTFLVDDDLGNYLEIYNWFQEMRNPASCSGGDVISDCTLEILSNQKNHLINIDFYNCFPSALSSLPFNNASTSAEALSATVTIEYMYYGIK